jgi:Domain of unknown function (DUF4383)
VERIRVLGWVYSAMFVSVVVVGYIPALNDEQGQLLGLFSLQLHDDALHLASAIWAAIASWRSAAAASWYFRIFGPLYFLDGVLGLLTGSGYLDAGIFLNGPVDLSWAVRIGANTPHLLIGGGAVLIGYLLGDRGAGAPSSPALAR